MSHLSKFAIRVLFEQSLIEDIGLLSYVHQLLNRRWGDASLQGYIFAIPNTSTIYNNSFIFLKPHINPIGNQNYICTIIITDPCHPTVLVMMNHQYAFVRHFLNQCSTDVKDQNISMIAHQKNSVTIVAIMYDYLINKKQITCATNIPRHVKSIITGIFQTYNARIISYLVNRDLLTISAEVIPQKTHSCIPSDLCLCSLTPKVIKNFGPYYPYLWSMIPISSVPDSPPDI